MGQGHCCPEVFYCSQVSFHIPGLRLQRTHCGLCPLPCSMAMSSSDSGLCDITARLGSIAMQRHSTAPWPCPIACHCVSRSHELPDCYVILFGCYGTATHCYMLPVTELHTVATHPRFGACSWAQLAARMLVWLLRWSFEALAKGLELELGAESRTQPRQRWE